MIKKTIIFLLLILSFCAGYASQLHVRVDKPIYSYLERMAVRGLLPQYLNSTLPLSRNYLAERLVELNEQRNVLSNLDQKLLDEYLADYRYDLKDINNGTSHFSLQNKNVYYPFSSVNNIKKSVKNIFSYQSQQEEHHIVVYETKDEMIWLDIDEMGRYERKNSIGRLLTQTAFHFSARIGDHFCLFSEAMIYDQGVKTGFTEKPDEYKGGFWGGGNEELMGRTSYSFDYANSYINYSGKVGDISFGVEPLIWGNSAHSLILSDNVDPFAFISWEKIFGKTKYSFFHGFINPSEETKINSQSLEKSYIEKYIVGHRWEVAMTSKIHFAFSEMLIYGERNPELVYFVPAVFLWPIQHSLTAENEDNILWFFEGTLLPVNGLKCYGTVFIDELRFSEIFEDSFRNRWAVQAGFLASPGNIPGIPFSTDIRCEFTATRPWAYTHRVPVKSSYTHNGRSLGFYSGPNSQQLFIENRWWLTTRNKVSFIFQNFKHGKNELSPDEDGYYPLGDDSNQNYELANPSTMNSTKWLMGDIQSVNELSVKWYFQMTNILFLETGFARQWDKDASNNYFSLQLRFDY